MRSLFLIFLAPLFIGCSTDFFWQEPEPEVRVVGVPSEVPKGTLRYCWEEPMVTFEENGPGLDEKGHWYALHHTAVREVRRGKWRPCRKALSERQKTR